MRWVLRILSLLLSFLIGAVAWAQGGPPLLTDDPGTPGNGNWEINLGLTADSRPDVKLFETPILDMNYGAGDRVQLKVQIPWIVESTNPGATTSGLGNTLIGVKWRFYQDEKHGLEISTYPQFELETPSYPYGVGLVDAGPGLILPFEVTKKLGPLELDLEEGYLWERGAGSGWLSGVALGHQATKKLEVLGEIYSYRTPGNNDETFDLGGRYALRPSLVLLFMAGRSFLGPSSGQSQAIAYLGLQFLVTHGQNGAGN
jgi:hypothetical protein